MLRVVARFAVLSPPSCPVWRMLAELPLWAPGDISEVRRRWLCAGWGRRADVKKEVNNVKKEVVSVKKRLYFCRRITNNG